MDKKVITLKEQLLTKIDEELLKVIPNKLGQRIVAVETETQGEKLVDYLYKYNTTTPTVVYFAFTETPEALVNLNETQLEKYVNFFLVERRPQSLSEVPIRKAYEDLKVRQFFKAVNPEGQMAFGVAITDEAEGMVGVRVIGLDGSHTLLAEASPEDIRELSVASIMLGKVSDMLAMASEALDKMRDIAEG